MFKSLRIYIKIRRNNIEVTNLETGASSSKSAVNSFSSIRNVVSNFNNAGETVNATLDDLGIGQTFFSRPLTVLIQQLEGTEGGLSDIEKRALRDLAEMAGGRKVVICEDSRPLTIADALSRLDKV